MPSRRTNYGPRVTGRGAVLDATQRQARADGPAAAFHPNERRKCPLPEAKPRRAARESTAEVSYLSDQELADVKRVLNPRDPAGKRRTPVTVLQEADASIIGRRRTMTETQ